MLQDHFYYLYYEKKENYLIFLLWTQYYTKQYWLQIVPLDIKGDKGINDFENWLFQRSGIIIIPNILPKNWFKDKFCFFHTQHNIASNERGGLLFISAGLSNILPYLSHILLQLTSLVGMMSINVINFL